MNDPRKSLFRHCEAFDATAAKAAATQGLLRLNARTLSCRGTRRRRVARLSMNHTRNLLISLRSPLPGFWERGRGRGPFPVDQRPLSPCPSPKKAWERGARRFRARVQFPRKLPSRNDELEGQGPHAVSDGNSHLSMTRNDAPLRPRVMREYAHRQGDRDSQKLMTPRQSTSVAAMAAPTIGCRHFRCQ